MDVDVRHPDPDEFERFGHTFGAAFGHALTPEDFERSRRFVAFERNLAAYEGEVMVGTAAAHPLRLTVPGGELATAGVTAVAVLPTHRRRGILSRMMRRQIDLVREWGEPLAVLWASEGAIYGRYGYGLATLNARLDADRGVPTVRPPEPAGEVRLVEREEALASFPGVFDRVRAATPGFVARTSEWWDARVLSGEGWRPGDREPVFRVLLEIDGRPEAYALYRISRETVQGVFESRLAVQEALGATPAATREIWRYLFNVDLVARIRARLLALDHELLLLAAEVPRLRISVGDGLWLRLVDVAKALAGRRYATEGSLDLELADEFCPWNNGVWRLEGSPEGASARRVGNPELRLAVDDLAAAYLGGFSFAQLAAAGRVVELQPGALARADALFRTVRAPWCPETF
jgi:predicted acetyltransferase